MNIVAWNNPDGTRAHGALDGSTVTLLDGELFSLTSTNLERPLSELPPLVAPIQPRSIICVGLNYRDHAAESNLPIPTVPALFTKLTSTLTASGDAIRLPALSTHIDYEAELGVVIGRTTRNVSVDEALASVFGYLCVNDVSARDLQTAEGFGWVRGKSADTFCPVGPAITTADEISDPQKLRVRAVVNGETLQDSNTAEMIFTVAEIISFISQAVTLQPGDLICTGTPSGVGVARSPQRFLLDGDSVRIEIDGLSALENPVVKGDN